MSVCGVFCTQKDYCAHTSKQVFARTPAGNLLLSAGSSAIDLVRGKVWGGAGTLSTGVRTGFPGLLRISWAAVFTATTGSPTRSICFWNAEGPPSCAA